MGCVDSKASQPGKAISSQKTPQYRASSVSYSKPTKSKSYGWSGGGGMEGGYGGGDCGGGCNGGGDGGCGGGGGDGGGCGGGCWILMILFRYLFLILKYCASIALSLSL